MARLKSDLENANISVMPKQDSLYHSFSPVYKFTFWSFLTLSFHVLQFTYCQSTSFPKPFYRFIKRSNGLPINTMTAEFASYGSSPYQWKTENPDDSHKWLSEVPNKHVHEETHSVSDFFSRNFWQSLFLQFRLSLISCKQSLK